MARRFFVKDNEIKISGKDISVIGEEIHHINVLRHKVGDVILINKYKVLIEELSQDKLKGKIEGIEENINENKVIIKLYPAYLKSDKMEFVIQKAVELGANAIVPFLSKNCVVKLDEKDKQKKLDRLNKISLEASKQCGRSDIVHINNIPNISGDNFIQDLKNNTYNIFAYENSKESLKDILRNIQKQSNESISIGIIIGPEGGFDKTDINILKQMDNLHEVSLGKNILRAETASVNLLSIVNYELNNEI